MRFQCLSLAALIAAPVAAFAPAPNTARTPTNLMGMHQIRRQPCALELPKGPIPNLQSRGSNPGDEIRGERTTYAPFSAENGQVGNFGEIGTYYDDALHTTGAEPSVIAETPSRKSPMPMNTLFTGSKGPAPAIPERMAPARKPAMPMNTLPTQSVGPAPGASERAPPSRPALNMPVASMGAYKGPGPSGPSPAALARANAMRKAMTMTMLPYQSKGPSPAVPENPAPARKPAMSMDTLFTGSKGPAPAVPERAAPVRKPAMPMDTLPTQSKGAAPGASERAPPSRPALNMPVSSMGPYTGSVPSKAAPSAAAPAVAAPAAAAPAPVVAAPAAGPPKSYGIGGGGKKVGKSMGSYLNNL